MDYTGLWSLTGVQWTHLSFGRCITECNYTIPSLLMIMSNGDARKLSASSDHFLSVSLDMPLHLASLIVRAVHSTLSNSSVNHLRPPLLSVRWSLNDPMAWRSIWISEYAKRVLVFGIAQPFPFHLRLLMLLLICIMQSECLIAISISFTRGNFFFFFHLNPPFMTKYLLALFSSLIYQWK